MPRIVFKNKSESSSWLAGMNEAYFCYCAAASIYRRNGNEADAKRCEKECRSNKGCLSYGCKTKAAIRNRRASRRAAK